MPEIVVIFFSLSIVAVWGSIILTRHKERMTIIDKGLDPAGSKAMYERKPLRASPLTSLKWGIIFISIGVAVLLGLWLKESYFLNDGIIPGMIALFGGIGLVVFYLMANKKAED
jgi:hypothetical protein